MPRDMASLLSKPMGSGVPASEDTGSGADQVGMGTLQSLMQKPGGMAPGGPAPPSHEAIAAMLDQLGAFQQEWSKLLSIPDVGKKDIKGDIMVMMADMMGDGYTTLAQTMNQLKDLPTNPLGQKQWLEEHLRKAEQASVMLLQQAATMQQQTDTPAPPLKPIRERDHHGLITGAVKHYDHHKKKGR